MSTTPRDTIGRRFGSASWHMPLTVASIALAIAFYRMPARFIDGFLWGEDGAIFLAQARALGLRALITTYSGYLHALPRLIAGAFVPFAQDYSAPRPLAWICALVLCSGCAFAYSVARRHMSPGAALAFALTPVLVPHDGEVWLNITNLQSIVAPALLLLLWDQFGPQRSAFRSCVANIVRMLAIAVLTLTGPYGIVYAPVVCGTIALSPKRRWSRASVLALAVYGVALCIQAAAFATALAAPRIPLAQYVHFPWIEPFVRYLLVDFAVPVRATPKFGAYWVIAGIVVSAAMAIAVFGARGRARIVCIALAAMAVLLWALGVVRGGTWTYDLKWDQNGGRYFYVPYVFFAWALIVSATHAHAKLVRGAACFVLALSLMNSLGHFKATERAPSVVVPNPDGPGWILTVPPIPKWNIAVPAPR